MKKIVILLIVCTMIIGVGIAAPLEAKVVIDGKEVKFPDQKPIIENSRTLVPVRFIGEALGAKIGWSEKQQKVSITKGNESIQLIIGENIVVVGSKKVELDVPAKLLNGRTLVPLRFISEIFGCQVGWDSKTYTVTIATIKETPAQQINEVKSISISEKVESETAYKNISEAIYAKYKNLGNKVVLTSDSNGVYYDPNGVPSDYKFNTPLMFKFGYSGSEYAILMRRPADETAKAILKDILKVFYPKDYESAYKIYIEYLNRKPSSADKSTSKKFENGTTWFIMHNDINGVVCDIGYVVNE